MLISFSSTESSVLISFSSTESSVLTSSSCTLTTELALDFSAGFNLFLNARNQNKNNIRVKENNLI